MKNKIRTWARQHKIIIWTFNIIFAIIFFNAIEFNSFLHSEVCRSNIKQVNFYMAGAATIDKMYLKPLVKIFGENSLLLKPIVFVRDSLYNEGLSYLPKNDAESAVFWYYIKFLPFVKTKSKMNFYDGMKDSDDVYKNLQTFYKYPIKNQQYNVDRYSMLISTANIYIFDLIHVYENNKSIEDLYKDKKQIDRIKSLFTLFIHVNTNLEKSEPETLIKYYKSPLKFQEKTLINSITEILIGKGLYENVNSCNKPLIKAYFISGRDLLFCSEHFETCNLSRSQIAVIKERLRSMSSFMDKIPKSCSP